MTKITISVPTNRTSTSTAMYATDRLWSVEALKGNVPVMLIMTAVAIIFQVSAVNLDALFD